MKVWALMNYEEEGGTLLGIFTTPQRAQEEAWEGSVVVRDKTAKTRYPIPSWEPRWVKEKGGDLVCRGAPWRRDLIIQEFELDAPVEY